MEKYRTVIFDIVGYCNARCPYCQSGIYKKPGKTIIEPKLFEKAIDKLSTGIIARDAIFNLFMWGEPFLHPELDEILTILNNYGYKYCFSTNASRVPAIDKNFVRNLHSIIFSMSGFSQTSYNKIHGLKFDLVLNNIKKIVDECRNLGFKGDFNIAYQNSPIGGR